MGDQGDTGNVGEIKETIEKTEEEEASVCNQLSENGSLKDVSKEKSQEDQMMMEIRKVEKKAKEEGALCDPFRVRLSFSLAEKLQMTILGIFLVPVRFISAFLALNLAWAISCVGLVGLDNTQPVSGWRKHLQRVTCFLGRVCCMCMGFQVSKTGTQVSQSEAPVLIVAPHSTFFDAMAVFWTGLPFIVNREENRRIPFIGKCIEFAQAIFVSREVKDSREACKAEIRRRCDPATTETWEQFLIFPEGTTSNRQALMSFKPGGFLPGQPVQPVLMRYHVAPERDTVSWTWDQPHGFLTCFIYTACHWSTQVELEFLPPHKPTEEEKADPMLFASNVRKEMAEALGVQLCDLSFEDIKSKYSKKEKEA